MNGPFDPEFAVGGGQPLGYADLAANYNRAIVHSSFAKVHVNIRDTSAVTTNASNIVAGIHKIGYQPDTTIGGFNTIEELEQRCNQRYQNERFKWRRMARAVSGYNTNIGPGGKIYMFPLRFRGTPVGLDSRYPYGKISSETDGDPYGLTFDTSSFPSNESYFSIFAFSQPVDAAITRPLPYTYFNISIWYDVEFFAPIQQNQ